MNRSSLLLTLAGLTGLLFFWLTDPKWGPIAHRPIRQDESVYFVDAARAAMVPQTIDAAQDASVGTIVGMVGSSTVTLVGLWLVTRRTV